MPASPAGYAADVFVYGRREKASSSSRWESCPELDLFGNELSGPIPEALGALAKPREGAEEEHQGPREGREDHPRPRRAGLRRAPPPGPDAGPMIVHLRRRPEGDRRPHPRGRGDREARRADRRAALPGLHPGQPEAGAERPPEPAGVRVRPARRRTPTAQLLPRERPRDGEDADARRHQGRRPVRGHHPGRRLRHLRRPREAPGEPARGDGRAPPGGPEGHPQIDAGGPKSRPEAAFRKRRPTPPCSMPPASGTDATADTRRTAL